MNTTSQATTTIKRTSPTRGPWRRAGTYGPADNLQYEIRSGAAATARCDDSGELIATAYAEGNARVMAAAPELRALLVLAAPWLAEASAEGDADAFRLMLRIEAVLEETGR